MKRERIAVIGAGMAGTSAAFRLQQAGNDVVLFESEGRVGGRVGTVEQGGYRMDIGAAVFLGTYRESIQTIHDVGLSQQLNERPCIGGIPRGGKMHVLDFRHPARSFLTTDLFSLRAKLRATKLVGMLARNFAHLGYDDYEGLARIDGETSLAYSKRALGDELRDYFTEPLVRGTWAAEDRESSNALMLWSIKNMFAPSVFGLETGMGALPNAMAALVDTRTSHRVSNVTDNGKRVVVTFTDPVQNAERSEEFDAAVIATTAQPALDMYPQMDENHRQLYSTARYRGMVASMVGLNRAPTDTLTYVLVPTVEDPHYLAVISDHNKTSGHVPAGRSLYTLNSTHEHLMATMDWSESQMRDDAIACVKRYHGGDVEGTIDQFLLNRWKVVVPVVDAGRFREINRFQKALTTKGRVQFAGDLDRIPGVNGALVSGWDAAKRLMAGAVHR